MATPTRLEFDPTLACRHERFCRAMYEWQRLRLQKLCDWLTPEPAAARALARTVFLYTWRQPQDVWMAAGAECVARALAEHFRSLFQDRDGIAQLLLNPPADSDPASPGAARRAVLGLPLPWRLLYLLHDIEHYPAATLAAWLDLDPEHCGAMIHAARLYLRRRLSTAAAA